METYIQNAAIVGQVLFGLYFLHNALNHFIRAKMLAGYAASKKVPLPMLAVIGSGLLLLAGGLSVLSGLYLIYGLSCLVLFLLVVTFWIHNFWADKDPSAKMMIMVNFTKNMALLGAVLMFYGFMDTWPWVLS